MKPLALLLLAVVSAMTVAANPPLRVGLRQALDNNMISVAAKASGQSYHAKGLHLQVTNKSGSALIITVDPGLIFTAEDSSLQNLVLAGAEMITVQPFKQNMMDVQTFCTEAGDMAPVTAALYSRPTMGSDKLVQVANYLRNNRLFDGLGQDAVWAITSGHGLESVYDPSRDAQSRKLVEFMAGLLGKPVPAYFTEYAINTTPGQPVFTGKALKFFGQFEILLEEDKVMSLGIFDGSGKQIQNVFENRRYPGNRGHRFKVEFEAESVAPGPYFMRLKEGDQVLQERKIVVE